MSFRRNRTEGWFRGVTSVLPLRLLLLADKRGNDSAQRIVEKLSHHSKLARMSADLAEALPAHLHCTERSAAQESQPAKMDAGTNSTTWQPPHSEAQS